MIQTDLRFVVFPEAGNFRLRVYERLSPEPLIDAAMPDEQIDALILKLAKLKNERTTMRKRRVKTWDQMPKEMKDPQPMTPFYRVNAKSGHINFETNFNTLSLTENEALQLRNDLGQALQELKEKK